MGSAIKVLNDSMAGTLAQIFSENVLRALPTIHISFVYCLSLLNTIQLWLVYISLHMCNFCQLSNFWTNYKL